MTIIEMLARNAKLFPEKTAIIYRNAGVSYKSFYEKSNALANFLIGIGLKKGDKVGLLVKRTPDAVLSFLGVAAAGGIVFPIDYNQTGTHIQGILNHTRPTALIVDADFQQLLQQSKPTCEDKNIIVIGKKMRNGYAEWEDIMAREDLGAPDIEIDEQDIVYLNFTSGTTGIPKGAVTTHANIYWNTFSAIEALSLTPDDVHLCMFPVFCHPHEFFARALFLGGTFVLIDSISPKSIASAISEHNITCMMATASIYEPLLRLREPHSLGFSSLRIAESGGMKVKPSVSQAFEERFNIPIIQVWGSTETSGIALANSVDGVCKPESLGKPCPYYEIKIVGEDGKEVDIDEIGEMVIRGPAVCSEYFGNVEETEEHMKNGWYFTGDMVRKDTDGYFYFMGRETGMIKVAGMKVFPTEIEVVIDSFPEVAEVAVTGVLDGSHGEVPKAIIVPQRGAAIEKKDIVTYCRQKMPKQKIPRVIEFRTELPKSPGGKILYREL